MMISSDPSPPPQKKKRKVAKEGAADADGCDEDDDDDDGDDGDGASSKFSSDVTTNVKLIEELFTNDGKQSCLALGLTSYNKIIKSLVRYSTRKNAKRLATLSIDVLWNGNIERMPLNDCLTKYNGVLKTVSPYIKAYLKIKTDPRELLASARMLLSLRVACVSSFDIYSDTAEKNLDAEVARYATNDPPLYDECRLLLGTSATSLAASDIDLGALPSSCNRAEKQQQAIDVMVRRLFSCIGKQEDMNDSVIEAIIRLKSFLRPFTVGDPLVLSATLLPAIRSMCVAADICLGANNCEDDYTAELVALKETSDFKHLFIGASDSAFGARYFMLQTSTLAVRSECARGVLSSRVRSVQFSSLRAFRDPYSTRWEPATQHSPKSQNPKVKNPKIKQSKIRKSENPQIPKIRKIKVGPRKRVPRKRGPRKRGPRKRGPRFSCYRKNLTRS